MARVKVAKVTISLPRHLLAQADRLAREKGLTRSAVIGDLLEKEEQARLQTLLEEGHREMAEEGLRLGGEASGHQLRRCCNETPSGAKARTVRRGDIYRLPLPGGTGSEQARGGRGAMPRAGERWASGTTLGKYGAVCL